LGPEALKLNGGVDFRVDTLVHRGGRLRHLEKKEKRKGQFGKTGSKKNLDPKTKKDRGGGPFRPNEQATEGPVTKKGLSGM